MTGSLGGIDFTRQRVRSQWTAWRELLRPPKRIGRTTRLRQVFEQDAAERERCQRRSLVAREAIGHPRQIARGLTRVTAQTRDVGR